MPDLIKINNVEIPKGKQVEIDFNIARLPTHTMIDLPVYVYRAPTDGPVLLLTATLHGDELNGIEIIRQMMTNRTILPEAGTVIAIPVVNIYGFLQNSRELPDGKDLNRSFPGKKGGTLAQQVAHTLIHEIVPHIDYGIDFHTGGSQIHNFPQIRCVMAETFNRELAEAFAPPLVLNSTLRDKSFRKATSNLGKPVLLYEAGESMRWDEYSIQEGINGTLRVMQHLGMCSSSPPPNPTAWLQTSRWIRARYGGVFRPKVQPGAKVERGQILAQITDPFGEFQYNIKSPDNGYIISLNNMPIVHKGGALIHFGMENKK